jgi:uncharacterized protein (DUF1697 family)
MPQYIAFLRAINVGGRTVKMDLLRELFESLKLKNVETFIASGNVIFESTAKAGTTLEAKIATALQQALGYEVATFIRTAGELAAIAARQPFRPAELAATQAFNVAFLAEPLSAAMQRKLLGLKNDIDNFAIVDREVFWLCRQKQSDSKFSNAVLEKTIGQSATLRSMSTLQKLVAKYLA